MLVDDFSRLLLDRQRSRGVPLNFDDNEDFLILFHFFLHTRSITCASLRRQL